jgi:transcriptional regulator with XRE-family HTH domain
MSAPQVPSPHAVALGARLRALRARKFSSGSELARAVGWLQPKVSKLERGVQMPSRADLEVWVKACEAPTGTLDELLDMLGAARVQYRAFRDAWAQVGGIASALDEVTEIDRRSRKICEYQPAMVPGLVQTAAYAREALSVPAGPRLLGATPVQMEEKVAAQDRRQQVLYMPGKQIRVVIGEAALHTWFGSPEVLAGQRDRLIAVSGLATVEVRVLAFSAPSPVLPLAGFAVNDDVLAWVETATGDQQVKDPHEVAVYVRAFAEIWRAAASGAAAVELIRKAGG